MPVVLLLIASVVSVRPGGELHELGREGGSFRAEGLAVYSVAVPAEEAAEAECTFDGLPTEAVPPASAGIEVTHAGRTYIEVYDVSTTGDHDVHVSCTGVSNVGYTEMGMLGEIGRASCRERVEIAEVGGGSGSKEAGEIRGRRTVKKV